ncbi:MAG: F0F1 ATP synthase subunit gamma, partial [Gemmatimonadaceae bacterium]
MAKGRELKGRIKSTEGTRKITRTMEMVATSKLKRAQDRVVAARPYAAALSGVIGDLYSPALAEEFPLLRQPETVKRAAILLITSNRGLAGAFNSNLIKEARKLLAQAQTEGVEAELHITGRKGLGFFKYIGRAIESSRTDIGDRPTAENAAELVDDLMQGFIDGRLDALYLVYAKYVSPLSTPATTNRILPVTPPEK